MLNQLRRNPLTRKWIIYLDDPNALPELLQNLRRWRAEAAPAPAAAERSCRYCAGNEKESGPAICVMRQGQVIYMRDQPPADAPGWDLRVVPYEGPVLGIDGPFRRRITRIYDTMTGRGANELILDHPDHRMTVWRMPGSHLASLFLLVQERLLDLARDPSMGHLLFFRNSGAVTGSWTSHPHSQIVAAPFVPEKVQKELEGSHRWFQHKERCLFCDIVAEEVRRRELGKDHQIVLETGSFIAMVPFFASHPFEVWLIPAFHQSDFRQMDRRLAGELGGLLETILARLSGVLGGEIDLTLSLLTCPNSAWGRNRGYWENIDEDWHWRLTLVPRLPVQAERYREFSMGTGSRVNPVLPELAADRLRLG